MCSTVGTSLHGGDQILLMASYTSFTHFDSQPPPSERSFSSQLPLAFLLPISHLNHLSGSLSLSFSTSAFFLHHCPPSLPFGFCTITLACLFLKFHNNKKTGIEFNYFPVFSERCCLFYGGESVIFRCHISDA